MITPQPRHIDLRLPQGWNQCTTDELEMIAAALTAVTSNAGRYHPFDIDEVKIEAFLAINKLAVLRQDDDDDEPAFLVRQDGDDEPFALPVSYIHAMIAEHFAWLDDKKAAPLVRFPYPELVINGTTLAGPPPMLDGYCWQDYRHLQDWMQAYMTQHNQVLRLTEGTRYDEQALATALRRATTAATQAQSQFLAVLFKSPPAVPSAAVAQQPPPPFDPIRWQVILFWWEGLMKILARTFPHVFKSRPVKRGEKKQSPWDFYNRITATLQKDGHLSEVELNSETYSVTLQKLEMMALEAEEMKRINKK